MSTPIWSKLVNVAGTVKVSLLFSKLLARAIGYAQSEGNARKCDPVSCLVHVQTCVSVLSSFTMLCQFFLAVLFSSFLRTFTDVHTDLST